MSISIPVFYLFQGGMPSEAEKLLTHIMKKDHPYPPQITKFAESTCKGVEFGAVVKVKSMILDSYKLNKFFQPIDFTPILIGAFFIGSMGFLVWILRKVIFNRIPAAILVIGFCLITTSGYTFCQIRGAPMKGRDGKYFLLQLSRS